MYPEVYMPSKPTEEAPTEVGNRVKPSHACGNILESGQNWVIYTGEIVIFWASIVGSESYDPAVSLGSMELYRDRLLLSRGASGSVLDIHTRVAWTVYHLHWLLFCPPNAS